MEADFTRYYQTDLRAACWGLQPWGVRRLLSHVKNLPRDSAYVRSLQGVAAYWDETAEMLAQLYDAIERQTFYLLKVNGVDPPEFKRFPRPGVTAAEPQTVSLAQWATTL